MEPIVLSYFDYVVIGIIILSGFLAFFRGFLQECLSLVLWVIALAASMSLDVHLDPFLLHYIQSPAISSALFITFIFVGLLVFGGFLIKLLRGLIHWSGLGGLDRLLGVLFGFLRGFLLIFVIYIVLPNNIKQSKFIADSESSYYLEKYVPMAEKFFKNMISDGNSVMLKSNISKIHETL